MLRLLELPSLVLEGLINKTITMGHARTLIGVDNADEILIKIIKNKLSVRQVEKLVSSQKKGIQKSGIKKTDPNISELESELSEKIGLKTSIHFNEEGSSGSITLYYSDLDQLDEVMKRLKK